jgi:hypothetical protein
LESLSPVLLKKRNETPDERLWMRRVMSEPPRGGSPRDDLSRFDSHLRYISTALFGAGMVAVLLVANFDLVLPHTIDRAALNLIVGAAGLSVAGILLFPWRRYHRNLFLVAV